jgi:hypothetical protein
MAYHLLLIFEVVMKKIAFIIFSLFFAMACDWREFDQLSQEATVQVVDGPEDFSGSTFGQVVTHLLDSDGNKIPGTYMVAGGGSVPFAIISFTAEAIDVVPIPFTADEPMGITTLIPLRSRDGVWRFMAGSLDTIYLLGIAELDGIYTVEIERIIKRLNMVGFGRSIVEVEVSNTNSYLIASNDELFLYNFDGEISSEVLDIGQLVLPDSSLDRNNQPFLSTMMIDSVLWFVVGGSSTISTPPVWSVLFINSEDHTETFTLDGSESFPGEDIYSIRQLDVDMDGKDDLILGTGENIYIYNSASGGTDAPFSTNPNFTLYSEGRRVGQVLEIGDLDDDGVDEIIASDPTYQDSNHEQLGEVSIYPIGFVALDVIKVSPAIQLKASSNEKKFGSSIITIPSHKWNTRDELIIGGLNSSYIFFITGFEGDNSPEDDPRD